MKNAEKVRKLVTRISAGVIFAALLIVNLQISVFSNGNSQLSLSKLAYGMFVPALGEGGGGSAGAVCPQDCSVNDHCSISGYPDDSCYTTGCLCACIGANSKKEPIIITYKSCGNVPPPV
jgi:hypothetical protein